MKLALGTVQFGMDYGISMPGRKVNVNEVLSILDYARRCKINLLDTAPGYGDSEKVLGACRTKYFNIVTKTRNFNGEFLGKQELNILLSDFNRSLYLLGRKKVYGVLVHNANDLLSAGSGILYRGLMQLKENGLVDKIGVSIYNQDQLKGIIENYDIDLIQLPLNILDRRLIDDGAMSLLKNKDIEIHARSIFLQGLLLTSTKEFPAKFTQWKYLWNLWDEWLNDNNITALEATVRYSLSITEISKVLVGVHSKKHLQEIVKASYGNLPSVPKDFFTSDINLLNPSNW